MPLSKIHERKQSKNLMVLGAIVAWIALIFIVTIIRISNG